LRVGDERERERERERYIKITKVEKQSGMLGDIWITTTFRLRFPHSYCVKPFERNNDVCQMTLLQSIISSKGLTGVYMQNKMEGKES
jgi:hypothetical protein